MKKTTPLFLLTIFLFHSCAFVLGIKNPQTLSRATIIKTSHQLKSPLSQSFMIKDSLYVQDFLPLEKTQAKAFNDVFQPLQLKVYHKNQVDSVATFLVNCYIGGLFHLKWNRLGSFDEFPLTKRIWQT